MATIRSGYVRVTSDGVYKGREAQSDYRMEYEVKPRHNGLVLFIGLVLIAILAFAIMHATEIHAALY